MQKKHLRILATAACLSAGLAFSAYGEEAISYVPLSFSWDGAPKGGEMVGTLIASTTSKAFIVEGSEYLKDDDTWTYGEWPCAEIELSAAEGYHFSRPNRRTFSLSGFLDEPGDLVLGQAEYKVSHGLPWCLGVCCIGKRIGFFQFIK